MERVFLQQPQVDFQARGQVGAGGRVKAGGDGVVENVFAVLDIGSGIGFKDDFFGENGLVLFGKKPEQMRREADLAFVLVMRLVTDLDFHG